jgi:hypothetical protein
MPSHFLTLETDVHRQICVRRCRNSRHTDMLFCLFLHMLKYPCSEAGIHLRKTDLLLKYVIVRQTIFYINIIYGFKLQR